MIKTREWVFGSERYNVLRVLVTRGSGLSYTDGGWVMQLIRPVHAKVPKLQSYVRSLPFLSLSEIEWSRETRAGE